LVREVCFNVILENSISIVASRRATVSFWLYRSAGFFVMASFQIDFPSRIVAPPVKTYAPVGHCIYCGHDRVELFPEHIIPFGIAGNSLILPESSCKRCGDITGKVETYILRHSWWAFRAKMGAPTNRPRERPKEFTLRRARQKPSGEIEIFETKQVPTEDYPASLVALRLRRAGILEGRPATDNLEGELWTGYAINESLRAGLKKKLSDFSQL
jgi:hypothetical protein